MKNKKNIISRALFITLANLLICSSLWAQSPQRMSYQAVIRNADGELVKDHAVGMKISILRDSPAGTLVYQEIFNPNPETNVNGLVTIEIGGGIPLSGTFSAIDWSGGTYYLRTETDPTGATNYTITGTSQLLSVPYALHATTVASYPETDPVFDVSPAAGITKSDINDWAAAYDWGNHAEAGYAPVGHTHTAEEIGAATEESVDALQAQISSLENRLISSGMMAKDADGNYYSTVRIGNQTWMVENLRTTRLSDGTEITLVTVNIDWIGITTPGYCWYDNNPETYGGTYGAMYNWYAVSTTTNGGKNICPAGWHVPSVDDWDALETFMIANGYNYDGSTSEDKLAKSLASTTWETSAETGAPGNTDFAEKRNLSGFTFLPGGFRNNTNGAFALAGYYGNIWSSDEYQSDPAKGEARCIYYYMISLFSNNSAKAIGLSVRCMKD